MSAEVPLRRSLLVRLLAASIVIAVCSTAATAWLVMQGTTKAIRQEQGQSQSNNAHIYDTLVGYAATHPSWDGVGSLVHDLILSTGQQIALATQDRRTIVGAPPTGAAFASVDPLHVDPALVPAQTDQIDDRAVGPFQLAPGDRQQQRATADPIVSCLQRQGATAQAVETHSGRITITSNASQMIQQKCGVDELLRLAGSEQVAQAGLQDLANTCLLRQGFGVKLSPDGAGAKYSVGAGDPDPGAERVRSCLASARREQLSSYVAPPVLLYIHGPETNSIIHTGFTLSADNVGRVAGVAALVLLVTIAVTVVVGIRLVRPLRALTAAVQHSGGRRSRVRVTGRDEIGVLAAVLNHMSERRQQAEEQRRAMVSDIAHELRTPLANIRSWLEAAEDRLATPTSDPELTSSLLAEALQLQHIVNDLQDLAAADAGTLRLDRQPVRVDDLVRRAVTAHRGGADAAGVRIDEETDDALDVVVDPVRIAQALGNLIANAVRYTPSGGVVTVQAFADTSDVVLAVSDTGPGIAADDLPHVFDRFWRADPSRTRDTGGSGLGLAIVRQLVEAHDGTVTATSASGLGATFTVRLPRTSRLSFAADG